MWGPALDVELDDGQRTRVDSYRDTLNQGDVLHLYAYAVAGAPGATLSETTQQADEYAEFPVTSVERRLPSGLWAIVTQTCDIRRDLSVEPFLQLASILEASEDEWQAAEHGKGGVRQYAYPPFADLNYPVLDIRLVQSIEKAALADASLDPTVFQFDTNERGRLSAWLARRYARHAFPDDLEREVLGPVRSAVKDRRSKSSEAGSVLRCREAILVNYTDTGNVHVFVVLNQSKTVADKLLGGDPKRIKTGIDQIFNPVHKLLAKNHSSFHLEDAQAVYPANLKYADVLYRYHALDID